MTVSKHRFLTNLIPNHNTDVYIIIYIHVYIFPQKENKTQGIQEEK